MKHRIQRSLWIAFSLALVFSLTACAKSKPTPKTSTARPHSTVESETAAKKEKTEPAPQESKTDYLTYQVPDMGIEFDYPASFTGGVTSNGPTEKAVAVSLKDEAGMILVNCSRKASLDELASALTAAGRDSSVLDEGFESLDVDSAIANWQNDYEVFTLLDSFSTPDSYGFYYAGKASYDDFTGVELGYRYKNCGGFGEDSDPILVNLIIMEPATMDKTYFIALCKAVTNSLRMTEAPAGEAAPPEPERLTMEAEALKGSDYEEQCREIVNALFQYAPNARYDEPRLYLQQLFGGNEALFDSLNYRGGLLETDADFSNRWSIQECDEYGSTGNAYYVNVNEIRAYTGGTGPAAAQYAHTVYITINSPTDYYITGVDSEYRGEIETLAATPSPEPEYDSPDEFEASDAMFHLLARLPSYGANTKIVDFCFGSDSLFYQLLSIIESGDVEYAHKSFTGEPLIYAAPHYQVASAQLEHFGFTDTPLYDLTLHLQEHGPSTFEQDQALIKFGLSP